MKEETKKRINRLVLPLTKRTLSILSAATIMTTGLASCKEDNKEDTSDISTRTSVSSEENSEISSSQSVYSEDKALDTSESTVYNSVDSKTNNTTSVKQNNNNNSKPNSTTNAGQNSNNNSKSNNNTSNKASSSSAISSSDSSKTSQDVKPMPNKLTKDNVNDVNVFNYFAENVFNNTAADITTISYNDSNGKKHTLTDNDYRLLLCLLNSNYLKDTTYSAAISYESLDNMLIVAKKMASLVFLTRNSGFNVNYNGIVIDNNKKVFLNSLQQIVSSQNEASLKKIIEEFFTGKNKYINYTDDAVIDYTVIYILLMTFQSEDSFSQPYMYYYSDIVNNFDAYVENSIYNKIKGKQLTK